MDRRSFVKLAGAGAASAVAGLGLTACVTQAPSAPTGDVRSYSAVGQPAVSFDYNVDVLVVGSGMAGLSAAMLPVESGLSVLVMEREDLLGGESYESSGVIRVCDTQLQKQAGIGQSPSAFWQRNKDSYLKAGLTLANRAESMLKSAPEWLDHLVDEYGASFADPKSYKQDGPVDILVSFSGLGDTEMIMLPLRDKLAEKGVTFTTEHECVALVLDGTGAIAGARFTSGKAGTVDVRARAVVVATGGYSANQLMVHANNPDQELLGCCSRLSQGNALSLCSSVGAATADLNVSIMVASDVPDATWWGMFAPLINVSPAGKRLAREDDASATAEACVADELGFWWSIFDNQMSEGVQSASAAKVMTKRADRLVGPCDTVSDLAAAMNIPADALEATMEAFNKAMEKKKDEEFGRELQMKSLKAPYYALKQFPVRSSSRGGVMTDEECRVLDELEKPIGNLYCCGTAAAGSVEGLSTCGSSGFITGRTVVADLTGKE
ncbi:FAD-dependent oxidoreductase [Adlercreutzia sp. ZJ141]|uniref:FAD-dependent oxidoreductase n=1 Tax=Adlercreutzia sp. ZJ141 TaxID=2709406 RepID=UPI0013EDF881|nr:FAD-dependent oxidoreductase [Adlercreutzia sp. ZJ141]